MKMISNDIKEKLSFLTPILPYGVTESWDDLNPRLYHAVHIYWLKFYGMWYNDFSPKNILFWLQLLYTMISFWLVCFVPGIGEVIYLLKRRDDVGDVAEGLYLLLSEMYTYFKIAVFWRNKYKIMELLEYLHCEEFKPKENEHKDILRRSIEKARGVMTYYSIMCVFAVTVAIIMPMTENFKVLPTNVEYAFFNVYDSPAYEAIYIHHIYYKPATCIIDGVMDTFLASFVSSAIGQIEILSFNIRNFTLLAERRRKRDNIDKSRHLGNNNSKFYPKSVLRDCIIHHNSIIKYVSMIEGAFSLASALQLMLSAMVLCLIGIQFLSIEEPKSHPMQIAWMVVYLTCMLTEFFILCWFGDKLIWKSLDLRQAAYEAPWPDVSAKTNKFIIVFLERCNRPLQVTAGKIFILSLDTYTVLINWAYKAFAVISKMKK